MWENLETPFLENYGYQIMSRSDEPLTEIPKLPDIYLGSLSWTGRPAGGCRENYPRHVTMNSFNLHCYWNYLIAQFSPVELHNSQIEAVLSPHLFKVG